MNKEFLEIQQIKRAYQAKMKSVKTIKVKPQGRNLFEEYEKESQK